MKKVLKVLLPVAILGGGLFAAVGIMAASDTGAQKKAVVQTEPLVATRTLTAISHAVTLSVWGELQPTEKTRLSLQVGGRISQLHSRFVAGGIIKKGDVILTIEDADYQTQLVGSQSALAKANADLAQEQALFEIAKLQSNQKSTLGLRTLQLHSAQIAVKSAQAQLSQSQRNLDRTQLIAPYDALVVKRDVGLGQLANAGVNLGEIYNIESAEIALPIPRFEMSALPGQVKGLKAQVKHQNAQRSALIDRDMGIVDATSRMSHIIATIEDPYAIHSDVAPFKFGQYVQVDVQGKVLDNVYQLNQTDVEQQKVWLMDANQQLHHQPVSIERVEGKQIFVSGLNDNDQLVVQVPEFPQEGMKVRSDSALLASVDKAQ